MNRKAKSSCYIIRESKKDEPYRNTQVLTLNTKHVR